MDPKFSLTMPKQFSVVFVLRLRLTQELHVFCHGTYKLVRLAIREKSVCTGYRAHSGMPSLLVTSILVLNLPENLETAANETTQSANCDSFVAYVYCRQNYAQKFALQKLYLIMNGYMSGCFWN